VNVVIFGSLKKMRPTEEATSLPGETNLAVYIVAFTCALDSPAVFMLCSIAQQGKKQKAV